MTHKELLEFAARAVGFGYDYNVGKIFRTVQGYPMKLDWNPLEDDGDALRLAVDLKIKIQFPIFYNDINCDRYAITRREIVQAAAEIGKRM